MSITALFDLTGKTALVTGCKRGIGRGMAEALAAAGADIIGVSASLEAEGSAVEQAVNALGRRFTGFRCDFSDRTALNNFIEEVEAAGLAPDILVNNAGTTKRKQVEILPSQRPPRKESEVERGPSQSRTISRENIPLKRWQQTCMV